MDPITLAITAALGKLAEQIIHDAYDALKAALAQKCGVDSKLLRSVKDLEEDPTSAASRMMIQEQVAKTGIDKDPDIVKATQALQSLLGKSQIGSTTSIVINQKAGNNALQIGQVQGNLDLKQ
ncbi:MAG TPA: hypothetical protein VMP08_26180 [Anaerolineae bacterium]|nr:hypothetical protein [Anaerolineae bacterium]